MLRRLSRRWGRGARIPLVALALMIWAIPVNLTASALAGPAADAAPLALRPITASGRVQTLPADSGSATTADAPITVTGTTVTGGQRLSSLPRPNSGSAPKQAGDRGGPLQLATFALMCAGLAFIAFRIIASSARARRRMRAGQPTG